MKYNHHIKNVGNKHKPTEVSFEWKKKITFYQDLEITWFFAYGFEYVLLYATPTAVVVVIIIVIKSMQVQEV